MTKPDGVLEIIRNALAQDRLYQLGQPFLEDYDKKAAHAIREYLANELPKQLNSHDRSNEGFNRDYITGYNAAITAAQERIREGGQP